MKRLLIVFASVLALAGCTVPPEIKEAHRLEAQQAFEISQSYLKFLADLPATDAVRELADEVALRERRRSELSVRVGRYLEIPGIEERTEALLLALDPILEKIHGRP